MPTGTLAFERLQSGYNTHQGGLTFTIGADQGNLIAADHFQVSIIQDLQLAIIFGSMFQIANNLTRLGFDVETDIHLRRIRTR